MKIKNAWICQVENNSIRPVFGEISFSNGKIAEIKELKFSSFDFKSRREKDAIDAGGRVVTIPSINFHDHFYSRLAKGLMLKGPMDNFHNILKTLWWKFDLLLDDEMTRASAQMAAMESIRNGVTYIFDHQSSPGAAEGSLEVISETLNECGLRGVLGFEITDRNGESNAVGGLKETERFLKDHSNDENIKSIIGLHASFTLFDSSLENAKIFLDKYETGIHIHLCEDKIDSQITREKYNKLPTERLAGSGLLNDKSILAHGIHLSKKEFEIIAERGSALVFNPDSNMNNAVGLPAFVDIPYEIPMLCGTDGMNSNPDKSLKQVFLLCRHSGMSFEKTFELIGKIYFNQARFVKKYFPDFPSIHPGDRADFIIRDYIPPTPLLKENFWGHFIYGIVERPVHSVIQDGKSLMNNFRLTKDFEEYNRNIKEQGHRLYNKLRDN